MFVHPDYRGGGRGRTLVESILQKSRQLGYRRCVLDTKAKLAAANKLYAVLGFVAWGNYNANPRADLFYALNFVEAPGDETVG